MLCEDVRLALGEGEICEETDRGARVTTHCLYPSFDPVDVFVTRFGAGFIVSDGGGAVASAWVHGREELSKVLSREASRYGLWCKGDTLECQVDSIDWLRSGILAVANASAAAANSALERVAVAAERVLAEKIYEGLRRVASADSIHKEYEHRGSSGKRWRFDFGVNAPNELLLVNAVAPHHVSVSAKYVAFADTPANDDHVAKLAVYGRKLETEDAALITQVATLVPIGTVEAGIRRVLAR